jgi:hypothetical protein
MRSTKLLSGSKFFGERYQQYVDEITGQGTINGQKLTPAERKEGFKKRNDKINFEKFVNKVLEKKSGPAMSGGDKALPGSGRGGAIVKSSGVPAQSFVKSPVSEKTQENLDDVMKGIDSILETLRQEQKFKKQVAAKNKKDKERKRRSDSEDKLENKGFSALGKSVGKVLKPVKSIFDRLLKFLFTLFIGRLLVKLVDWFSDEENKKSLDAIGRFLKDTWPALLAAYILFGTGFGGFIRGLVGLVTFFIPKIFKLTKSLLRFAGKNPMAALAIAGTAALGYAAYTGTQESKDPERAAQGKTQLDDNLEGVGNFAKSILPFSTGGRVPGTGTKDTVPAMLTPGEFVMSRGAVSKFGMNTMSAMNSSGGGSGIPSLMNNGLFGYSSGGAVPSKEEPGSRDFDAAAISSMLSSRYGVSAEDTKPPQIKAGPGAKESSGGGDNSLKLTNQDFRDLAFIVSAEAQRGTDDEYGVAAAVLNRLMDPKWPNTIKAVGEQQGQFAAVFDGHAYDDPELAKKLGSPEGQASIVDAMKKLNGRTDFKGTSQYGNMGKGDIKFSDRGNFYHYTSQVGKNDPPPSNPPQHWKKLIGKGGPAVDLSTTTASGGGSNPGSTRGSGSYDGSMTSTKPKAKITPLTMAQRQEFFDSLKLLVDGPAPSTPSPSVSLPNLNASAMQDSRKAQVLGVG